MIHRAGTMAVVMSAGLATVGVSTGVVGQVVPPPGQPPTALGAWETLINFAPQLAFGAALFFAMKYVIDNFRGDITKLVDQISRDNERRDTQYRQGLDKFEEAIRSSNQSSERQMTEVAQQLKVTSDQDRIQNAKMFDAIFGLTREAVMEMGALKASVRSLEQEVRTGRRGSALPPPDGGSPARPRAADDP